MPSGGQTTIPNSRSRSQEKSNVKVLGPFESNGTLSWLSLGTRLDLRLEPVEEFPWSSIFELGGASHKRMNSLHRSPRASF
jgi:hypothetical protein